MHSAVDHQNESFYHSLIHMFLHMFVVVLCSASSSIRAAVAELNQSTNEQQSLIYTLSSQIVLFFF